MPTIKPISELRNYPDILKDIGVGSPVFLTKNGYGSMVVMSLEQYSALTDETEWKLLQADKAAETSDVRYTAQEVFGRVRSRIHG